MVVTGEQGDQGEQNSRDDGEPALPIESRNHRSQRKRTFSLSGVVVLRHPCKPRTWGVWEAAPLIRPAASRG